MAVDNDEALVRALHLPFWDPHNKRGTKSAFQYPDVSVSRTGILAYEEIVAILQHDLNTATRTVEATATVQAGFVRESCSVLTNDVTLKIVEDPVFGIPSQMDNPAHALMLGLDRATQTQSKTITAGMANAILRGCVFRPIE